MWRDNDDRIADILKNAEIGNQEYFPVVYYYNPKLKEEIKQAILSELTKNLLFVEEVDDKKRKEQAEKLYNQMKSGEYANISEESITAIKRLVFHRLRKNNKNEQLCKYIDERIFLYYTERRRSNRYFFIWVCSHRNSIKL